MSNITLTMLGTRGSIPVDGEKFREFGGATSCVKYSAAGQEIFLDAGTGIVGASGSPGSDITILLSHPHLDHVIGIPFFDSLTEKDRPISVYLKTRNSLGIKDILRCLYTPPLWPLGVFDYPAKVSAFDTPLDLRLGDIQVLTMEGTHPGGVTIFKLIYDGVTVVYASDYEDSDKNDALADFSKDADVFIFDGQYTEAEYPSRKGFGHSTPDLGIEIARRAGAKKLLITHHAPEHDDETLRRMETEARAAAPDLDITFSRCGDVIEL